MVAFLLRSIPFWHGGIFGEKHPILTVIYVNMEILLNTTKIESFLMQNFLMQIITLREGILACEMQPFL